MEIVLMLPDQLVYSSAILLDILLSQTWLTSEWSLFLEHITNSRLQVPWLRGPLYSQILEELSQQAESANGLPVVHSLVESIRAFLQNLNDKSDDKKLNHGGDVSEAFVPSADSKSTVVPSVQAHLKNLPSLMPVALDSNTVVIFHGEPFVDRKSVFQVSE